MGKSKDTRRVEANQAMAVCHSIRTSPRKLNLVAQTIRGLNAEKAVAELSFSKEENRQSCFGRIAVRNCQCRKQPPVKHRQAIRQRSFCR